MAVMMAGLQDLAWLRMNAALRHEVPTFKWATVHTSSPGLTVILDGDESQQPRQVSANAVGPLYAGQRVRVEMQGTRITVTAAQVGGALRSDGTILLTNGTGGSYNVSTSGGLDLYSAAGSQIGMGINLRATAAGDILLRPNGGTVSNNVFEMRPNGYIRLNTGSFGYLELNEAGLVTLRSTVGLGRLQMQNDFIADGTSAYLRGESRAFVQGGSDTADAVHFRTGSTVRVIAGRWNDNGRLSINNPMTTSSSANCHITESGWFYRSTSLRDAKVDIREMDIDEDTYLELEPVDFQDRFAAEAVAAHVEGEIGDDDLQGIIPLRRIPGLIAEDVVESGNEWLATYGDDGKLIGVNYERGWLPLILIIKRLRDQVKNQESRILALEDKVDQLMSLLHDQQEEDESHD